MFCVGDYKYEYGAGAEYSGMLYFSTVYFTLLYRKRDERIEKNLSGLQLC